MEKKEPYQPTPEEMKSADEIMTEDQKELSHKREENFSDAQLQLREYQELIEKIREVQRSKRRRDLLGSSGCSR